MKRAARFPVLAATFLLVSSVSAATLAPDYDLSWWTVDGGGTTDSSGGSYTLGGTAGQPDAGMLTGGGYTLAGGFWGGVSVEYRVYLPLVVRNY
jgi:hypothetical protein